MKTMLEHTHEKPPPVEAEAWCRYHYEWLESGGEEREALTVWPNKEVKIAASDCRPEQILLRN